MTRRLGPGPAQGRPAAAAAAAALPARDPAPVRPAQAGQSRAPGAAAPRTAVDSGSGPRW